MLLSFRLTLALSGLVLAALPLSGQATCGERFPFSTGSSTTYCTDTSGNVLIEFPVINAGDPGNYTITFPDGRDTTLEGVSGSVLIQHTMAFECGRPPGTPLPPDEDSPFFQYNNDLLITRTDCVDGQGDEPQGLFKFNVIPNPIRDISITNATCLQPPFTVGASPILCNEFLVESYQWYLNGEPIRNADEKELTEFTIPRPGEYLIGLEVGTARGCGSFFFEKPVVITSGPILDVDFLVDSTTLCSPTVSIATSSEAENVETYTWRSSNPSAVSFSDPAAAEPDITIDNSLTGTFNISVTADNATCPSVTRRFSLTTYANQAIEQAAPLTVCTNNPLDLCDQLTYTPEPEEVRWTTDTEGVTIENANTTCPKVTGTMAGTASLLATGVDLCGDTFSLPFTVQITDSEPLDFAFDDIGTVCAGNGSIELLDYISPADNVAAITGPGVTGTTFDPTRVAPGPVTFSIQDSCGGRYTEQISVVSEGGFAGGNPTVCIGATIDLDALQTGTYTGPGVADDVFDSEVAGLGPHIIEFSSTDFCGGSGTFTVTVEEAPRASFEFTTPSCLADSLAGAGAGAVFAVNTPVGLVNTSTSPVINYRVVETERESGAVDSTGFTFPEAGTYTIEQIVSQPGGACADTLRRTLEIRAPFTTDFTIDIDSSGCDSLTVILSASADSTAGDLSYRYRFSNADDREGARASFTIPRPLSPETLLTYAEASNGCFSSTDTLATELPRRFQVGIGILNDNRTICSGDTAFLIDRSVNAANLELTLGDGRRLGAVPDYLVLTNPTQEVIAYPLRLSGSSPGCADEVVLDTIFILPVTTQAAFSLEYDDSCSPAQLSLINQSTPGSTGRVFWGDNSTPQMSNDGDTLPYVLRSTVDTTFTIALEANLCGLDTFQQTFEVLAAPDPRFTVSAPEAACTDEEFAFLTASEVGDQSLEWNFGDGGFSLDAAPRHTYRDSGTYLVSLEITATNGCSAFDSTTLEIDTYSGPPLELDIPTTICVDAPFRITATGGSISDALEFDYGNGQRSRGAGIDRPYQEVGVYPLTVSSRDQNGCRIDTSVNLEVFDRFSIALVPDITELRTDLGDQVQLTFTTEPQRRLDSIGWTGDRLNSYNGQFTVATPVESGNYTVFAIDEYGCMATDSLRISVRTSYGGRVYAPTAFSPNGDGNNETFGLDVKPNTVEEINYLRVVDRWGNLLYECRDCPPAAEGEGWDGKLNGTDAPTGSYIWTAELRFVDGQTLKRAGSVTLLR